jgi:hypothetical protein
MSKYCPYLQGVEISYQVMEAVYNSETRCTLTGLHCAVCQKAIVLTFSGTTFVKIKNEPLKAVEI